MKTTRYTDEDLSGQDFSNGILKVCSFRNCDLTACDFTNALVQDCFFEECDLASCTFKDTTMHGVLFTNCAQAYGILNNPEVTCIDCCYTIWPEVYDCTHMGELP